MKKQLLLILFVIFSIANTAHSQNLVYTVDTAKIWNVVFCGMVECTTETYMFQGDTTIGIHQYKKLYVTTDSSLTFYYNSALREDTLGKIYWVNYLGTEYLLYDFTLQAGDSTHTFPIDGIVDSVGTFTLLNGQTRKKMYISGYCDVWIEGIGSASGLIYPFGPCTLIDLSATLNCFTENDTLKYDDLNFPGCYYSTVGLNHVDGKSVLSLFPNPFSEKMIVTLNDRIPSRLEFILYDSFGKEVERYSENHSSELTIDRNGLGNGIYFYRLFRNDKSVATGKLQIQ